MRYDAETRRTDGRGMDVLAAWEVYVIAIASLTIYSLVTALA
ncbi:MAG: hypothetical protein OEQ39_19340 [Gammaproteobacteria bacterium]|nr:hypothetical protein [Gammaproteobacteria bacterium]MDH3379082.1 hypothetical protein [Gammaproteobacteria bacterium]